MAAHIEWVSMFAQPVLVRTFLSEWLGCDDNFDLQTTATAWKQRMLDVCMIWFVCERMKKEIRKRKKKLGKQSSVPPFIIIATKMQNDVRLKNLWKMKKEKNQRTRERKLQRERERERELLWMWWLSLTFMNAPFIKSFQYLLWLLNAFFLRPWILR